MMIRLIVQAVLALSLVEFIPVDGANFEQAARLPTSALRSSVAIAWQAAMAAEPGLPSADDRYPTKVDPDSLGVVTTAQSVLVLDRLTGLPLYQKNADAVRPIGSISKLMTAMVFLESAPNLQGPASILSEDYRDGGRLYLNLNDPVTVGGILKASLVGSDNSATITLVRLSGQSLEDFVARMNARATELGMTNTVFRDPTGLSAENTSTARDISRLLNAALAVSEIQSTVTMSEVSITQGSGLTVKIPSTDDLLQSFINQPPYQMLGGKTGYLPEAGYCISVGLAHEDEGEVLIVVLGSESKVSRVQEVKGLAEWAYRVFDWK